MVSYSCGAKDPSDRNKQPSDIEETETNSPQVPTGYGEERIAKKA